MELTPGQQAIMMIGWLRRNLVSMTLTCASGTEEFINGRDGEVDKFLLKRVMPND